ncbi:MAG: hypothetical protein KA765_00205 [Thermoflexales bacterium]|nr:hypothetical protein [Thermoflexales bacterium]
MISRQKTELRRLNVFLQPSALILLLAALLTGCASAPAVPAVPTPIPGALYVNAEQSIGASSPLVFGTNYGPWVFLMPAVKPKAIAAGLTYLRYPGGEYGDNADLMEYQIDEAAALAKELGADLSLCVRLMNGTPENAALMVKYANKTKGYNVKYWSIGNEPNLYNSRQDGIKGYDTVRFNQEWRTFAEAMRAVDPTIKLVGPDINQFTANLAGNPKDVNGKDWLTEFLKANGDLVDVVAVHRYPFPRSIGEPLPTIDQLLTSSEEWDQTIPALRQIIKEATGADKPIAVTEINSNWNTVSGGEATPETLANALWWGDALGRLIRNRTDIVAQFLLTSKSGAGGGEMGLLGTYDPRPIYYVYPMYKRFGSQLIQASTDATLLSIYAAKRADGTLTLMVLNRSAQAQTKPLQLIGFKSAGAAEVYRLDEGHKAEQLESQTIAEGAAITLPPYSMTLFVLPVQ